MVTYSIGFPRFLIRSDCGELALGFLHRGHGLRQQFRHLGERRIALDQLAVDARGEVPLHALQHVFVDTPERHVIASHRDFIAGDGVVDGEAVARQPVGAAYTNDPIEVAVAVGACAQDFDDAS